MLMERWRSLDLRRRDELGPYNGELIALHMVPETSAHSERYAVGRLEVVARRTWIYGGDHTLSSAKIRKRYGLLWVRLPEDGDEKKDPNHSGTMTRA